MSAGVKLRLPESRRPCCNELPSWNLKASVNRIIAELEARPEVKPALLRDMLTDEFLELEDM